MFPPEDDDVPTPPPLPDDRLWRHPSELAAAAAPPTLARPRRLRSLVSVGVVSGLAGATVAVAALASMGALTNRTDDVRSEPPPEPSTTVPLARTAAAAISPSVVELVVDDGTTLRHGSGVVLRGDGLIVTCADLLEGARSVSVRWASGRQATAAVSGTDQLTQLGALTVAGDSYPSATVDLTPLETGDEAVWVSNYSRSRPVATNVSGAGSGRISALGLIAAHNQVPAHTVGGAVVDLLGSLRAVAVGLAEDGTGRAVPIEVALRVADDLARLGRVDRGWLGVSGSPTVPVRGSSLPAGLTIDAITPGSPAASAGLGPGDDLISIDGERVRSLTDIQAILTLSRPGQTVDLKVGRHNEQLELRVVLGTDQPGPTGDTEVAISDAGHPVDPDRETAEAAAPSSERETANDTTDLPAGSEQEPSGQNQGAPGSDQG